MTKKYLSQDPDQNRRCWKCNIPIPKPFQMNSLQMRFARPPIPGDISICAACGAFGVFDGLLQIVKPDPAKMRQLEASEDLMQIRADILARL